MTVRISPELELPDDVVTQPCAILARRGAGKTYTASVLAEELIANQLPVVILDPLGVCWGLRASADGTKPGLPVTILGGDHGDVPLEETGGKVVANFVVDHPGAYVLDLSGFASNAAQDRFATDFAETLYRAKGRERSALHLIVDEADSFAPQRPRDGQQRMLGAFEAIVRRGRSRGLGITMISQRPAVLNKNVLSQIECLIALQVTAPQDRKALDDWAAGWSTPEERKAFLAALATLQIGQAWIWSPTWLQVFQPVTIRRRTTFDSSATPKAGERAVEPRVLADVDLDALKTEMAATIEKARADDPKLLRARIAELERELRARDAAPAEVVAFTVVPDATAHALIAAHGTLQELQLHARPLLTLLEGVPALIQQARIGIEAIPEDVPDVAPTPPTSPSRRPSSPNSRPTSPSRGADASRAPRETAPAPVQRRPAPAPATTSAAPDRLGKGERTVLDVLAQYPDGRTYNELAFLAGYSAKASTLGVILSNLRKAGLVEPGNQPVRPTPEGLDMVGGAVQRPTGAALLDQWLAHPRMGAGERTVLRTLIDAYPDDLSHDELCARTDYSPTASTIGVILSKLRKLGLVEKGARRCVPEFIDAIS